ncbi:hypothetical protein GCM10007416_34460 [Kroppenstedtia guangzhouensis]|uniref:Uncharacterized protein n=1 Tax=Kroppenstedtia guangzhouensis TaxID=1274356 RepID=A0ABQ1H5T1_9BACL|nr:hypothetical protein [Kroppenstedtia guangzhouensis]GGA58358.1 hypothetical protein GCM10007416_34460 [Kroppenstedtia guangzhouensis]
MKKESGIGWWLAVGGFVAIALLVVVAYEEGEKASIGEGRVSPTHSPDIDEPETINGVSARDVPVIVKDAFYCLDWKTLKIFLTKEAYEDAKEYYSDKQSGCEEKFTEMYPGYRLIEYKANENLYYYQLDYPSSNFNSVSRKEYFPVFRAKGGWKTFHDMSLQQWVYETQDLVPQVIKGVHDRP